MASHSNGKSAMQLKSELGLGSCQTAWLLAMILRKSMVAPERGTLCGLVEIVETTIALRTKEDPPAGGQGRSHEGKLLLAGAQFGLDRGFQRRKSARLHRGECRARRRRQNRWLAGLCWRT